MRRDPFCDHVTFRISEPSRSVTFIALKGNLFGDFAISAESDPQKVPRNDSLEQGFGPVETGNRINAKHTYSLSFSRFWGVMFFGQV